MICVKASVNYLRIIGKIMDSINDKNYVTLNN
jgi:hypothetical protein